ncbi:MAG TPA: transcription factor [Nitrososphaeraceae archaeon]|jgi:transcription initiation factor TFIIE subunit alpha
MHSAESEDPFVKIANLIGGEEYHKVARALLNTEDATDEEIAGATGMRINIIRKVLYDMFGKALITGIRVKDEKKGWFVYRWRAKRDQAENFIENQKKKILDRLQKRLEYEESSEFYHCGNANCPRIKFDYAMELFFKCPNCKNSLNMVDNEKVKNALRYKIEQILLDISSKDEPSS